jgi:hypothetical protein
VGVAMVREKTVPLPLVGMPQAFPVKARESAG